MSDVSDALEDWASFLGPAVLFPANAVHMEKLAIQLAAWRSAADLSRARGTIPKYWKFIGDLEIANRYNRIMEGL